jgi:hypothetical protein
MQWHKHLLVAAAVVTVVATMTAAAFGATRGTSESLARAQNVKKAGDVQHLELTPSSAQLAACMPNAQLGVKVGLTTEKHGFDRLELAARGLPSNTDFAVFLLQQAGSPFGAAEYIGDFSTDDEGTAHQNLRLIVQKAFSSTIVNGVRQRVDLNRIGVWFADHTADDFCLGVNSPITPFDGDNEAGVQAFNSANADPLPAP